MYFFSLFFLVTIVIIIIIIINLTKWRAFSDSEDDDEKEGTKRVKEHRVNRKPGGKMLGLRGMSNLRGNSDEYKEDTRLEDRLAMEAEEEKKYETGEGYGTGGGAGGGGAGWDDAGKGVNWATNIQRQDAAEVVRTLNTIWNVLI